MKFVYPVKSGTENYIELLCSVRSVAKHYPDAEIVIISGTRPTWANNKVIHYTHHTKKGDKGAVDVWKKMMLFCRVFDGSFIHMNDDIFIMHPFDYEKYNLFNGNLEQRLDGLKAGNFYRERVRFTISLLRGLRMTTRNYDIHQPMMLTSSGLLWMAQHFNFDRYAYLYKSLYGAIVPNDSKDAVHCKLDKPEDVDEKMIYFSTSNAFTAKQEGKAKLLSLFSDKCRFEK